MSLPEQSAGPYVTVVNAATVWDLTDCLRPAVAGHDDTCWHLVPPGSGGDTGLGPLSQGLLDAAGVVGLRTPRAAGERHLLRVVPHWVHGPVRHALISDADHLPTDILDQVQEAALVAGVQLWLLIDATNHRGHIRWAAHTCHQVTATDLLDWWTARPAPSGMCPEPPAGWWTTTGTGWPRRPRGGCQVHRNRVECLLSTIRRSLTRGTTSPGIARAKLTDLLNHRSSTVDDWWAATAAGRDLYTPASDSIITLPNVPHHVTIAEVAVDGSTVTSPDGAVTVPQSQRPALAWQRTCRVLAGCLPDAHLLRVMDQP